MTWLELRKIHWKFGFFPDLSLWGSLNAKFRFSHVVVEMRFHFWPLLVGALVLIWGIVTLLGEVFNIHLPVSWWAIVAIIVGIWILSRAVRSS